MNKYNLGIGLLIFGIYMIIDNLLHNEGITTGLILSMAGIMFMTKHRKEEK